VKATDRDDFSPGQGASCWVEVDSGHPIAAPLPTVAAILDLPLPLVEQAAAVVEPYIRNDGTPVWSVRRVGVVLGVRKPHYLGGYARTPIRAPARPAGWLPQVRWEAPDGL
jgi:hypothetical protein